MRKNFSFFSFTFSFLAFSVFWFSAAIFAVLAAETLLPAPTIAVNPDVYYPLEEVLYLEGRALPNSTVQIQFQRQGVKVINLNTKSDNNGEWVLSEKTPLEAGNWEVRARVIQSAGAVSAWSNPRLIKAIITGTVIGGVTVKFSFLLFLLLLVLTVSGFLVSYFYLKTKRLRNNVQFLKIKEFQKQLTEKTADLENVIIEKDKETAGMLCEKMMSDLRRDIFQESEHLKVLLGNPENKEELKHWEQLLKEVGEIEEKMKQKIKTIHQS